MAKLPEAHRDIHREADKREPRLEAAMLRGGRELAGGIDIDALELAIGTGDVNNVLELISEEALGEAYEELEELVAEAWLTGNELAAEELNEFLEMEDDDG